MATGKMHMIKNSQSHKTPGLIIDSMATYTLFIDVIDQFWGWVEREATLAHDRKIAFTQDA